jgi:hypothetical protein
MSIINVYLVLKLYKWASILCPIMSDLWLGHNFYDDSQVFWTYLTEAQTFYKSLFLLKDIQLYSQIINDMHLNLTISLIRLIKEKNQNLLTYGTYRVTNWDPYQSIDLIEYYKSCIGQNKLGRGRQMLEGAKVICKWSHFRWSDPHPHPY